MGLFSKGPIKAGDPAPDFELPDHTGETVRLSDHAGENNVVLFFYPKDETPVCTQEACLFRDRYAELVDAGAKVFGVSSDDGASHQRFVAKHDLPYPLLSDVDGAVRKRFGVPKTLGILPGRVTFVIDKGGIVRHVTQNQMSAAVHVDEALAALDRLR
ncbi:MAG TPA: peroxiredoxin [Myxococcales bacterium LLY-WYZ-16_1]|jgi:peroxiredoxin Q/BCP|nr:peroxiredoxin [Myxococcales bacterium LLY-WYZ-16_1]